VTEILSQKDIDALLQGAPLDPTGTDRAPDVVPYNFVRPPRVSKDRRASLEAIYGRYALSLQALLTSRLRTPVDVVLAGVEQVAFSEFVLSLASPCAAFVFKIGDRLGAQGVIDLGNDIAFHLVDRLFGGPGEPGRVDRPLTALEQTVVRSIVERTLALLREAWQEQLTIKPELVSFESNPEMLQITNLEDNVLVATLTVRGATGGGTIAIGLPMASFEPFLTERSATRPNPHEGRGDRSATRPLVELCLQQAGVTLSVRLPAFRLTTREIVGLQAGQVIQTGHTVDTPVDVHVNGRARFRAVLGQLRRRLGARIQTMISVPVASRPGRTREGRVS
jgi:flagellar motor switch protein FliM